MGQKKKIGGGIDSLPAYKEFLNRRFEDIAYSYGMTAEYAEEVLEKEFQRLHNGTKFSNYLLTHMWQELRALPDLKHMADYDLKLMMLPQLEQAAEINHKEKLPKDWKKEYESISSSRMKKTYESRVKVITSRIGRVLKGQKKEYNNWRKIKQRLLKDEKK